MQRLAQTIAFANVSSEPPELIIGKLSACSAFEFFLESPKLVCVGQLVPTVLSPTEKLTDNFGFVDSRFRHWTRFGN